MNKGPVSLLGRRWVIALVAACLLAGGLSRLRGSSTDDGALVKAMGLLRAGRHAAALHYYEIWRAQARNRTDSAGMANALSGAAEASMKLGDFSHATAFLGALLERRDLAAPKRRRWEQMKGRAEAAERALRTARELAAKDSAKEAAAKLTAFAAGDVGDDAKATCLYIAAAHLSWEDKNEARQKVALLGRVVTECPDSPFAVKAETLVTLDAAQHGHHADAIRAARLMLRRAVSPEDKLNASLLVARILSDMGDRKGAEEALARSRAALPQCEPQSLRPAMEKVIVEIEAKVKATKKGR